MRFKTNFSWRDCAVRARESGFDGMSPVGASIYCSPHPAALQIAPAARLQEFASRILRTEEFHGEDMKANDCRSLGKFIHPAGLAFCFGCAIYFLETGRKSGFSLLG
jgi:hypothetical protein